MSSGRWAVRAAHGDDIDALYELACMSGSGFTNLPPDREALVERLARSDASYARDVERPDDELYLLLLEETGTGRIGGSAVIFSRLGAVWPFYSYKLGQITQFSHLLGRGFRTHILTLVNDHEGASEVGGLFLRPELRAAGLGRLLARSRYLFIRGHRSRFCSHVLAELRGYQLEDGQSPFWNGIGRLFFGMEFQEADRFNALNGNQFIADLMPRHPIYVALLPEQAREAIGRPHDSGIGAMRMLEKEGFVYDGYVDIFDGGPTMIAKTDEVATIRASREAVLAGVIAGGAAGAGSAEGTMRASPALVAAGRLGGFRCWTGEVEEVEAGLRLPAHDVEAHRLRIGERLIHAPA